MARDEESRLIARAQNGQPEALRALVDTYKDRLFAFVWRILRNHHEAEDVCQSTFVKAFESLGSYSSQYAFSTWLYTIGYRLCLNHLRKRKAISGDLEFAQIAADEADTSDALANSEEARRLREMIWSAVDQLTLPQKSAVVLFYRDAMSCDEIGKVLDIPAVTVKSHLHRAREKLRKLLSAELVDDWMAVRHAGDERRG